MNNLWTVYGLESGFYIHHAGDNLSPHEQMHRNLYYYGNVITVEGVDHIDAYIKAGVPLEKIHEAFRGEVEKRINP